MNYMEAGEMELEVIDSTGEYSEAWRDNMTVGSGTKKAIKKLREMKVRAASNPIPPYSFLVQANPIIHRVKGPTEGERLSVVIFMGVDYWNFFCNLAWCCRSTVTQLKCVCGSEEDVEWC